MERPSKQHLATRLRNMDPERAGTLRYEARLLALRIKGLSYWGALELFYHLGCFLNDVLDDPSG